MKPNIQSRYILDAVLSLVGGGVFLFWPAGRLDWWPAWAVLGINAFMMAAMGIIIFARFPDLAEERLHPPKGAKRWDAALMSGVRLMQLARYIVAGLDVHYGWTVAFPSALPPVAFVIAFLGYALIPWAVAHNRNFSQLVRIQKERGHAVAMEGPYRIVRHPSYAGMIAFELAVPLLLASWYAFGISLINVALLLVRTALEDRTLREELPGYGEYADRVRYRLFPFIW